MDIKYTLQGIHFEWNSQKATLNRRKHGISFETACEAFHDPFVQALDEEIIDGELREALIGMALDWHLIYVVYIFRESVIRLVSARLVTKAERLAYEEQ